MFVLDTTVISELMRPLPDPAVVAWIASQPRSTLYTTSHTQAEILYGITALPKGRRRAGLAAAADDVFAEEFSGRVLPFGSSAAVRYASLAAARKKSGNATDAFDALIAATALAAGGGVVTRDVGGFEGCGLALLINPWTAS